MRGPVFTNLRYLVEYGGRTYVRRYGRKVRILAQHGTEEFAREYAEALDAVAGRPRGPGRSPSIPGTLGWLAAEYFGSAKFRALDPQSQKTRRGIIEACLCEPTKPGAKALMAGCPLSKVTPAAILMLMERKEGKPGAANNRKKYLSAMFRWGIANRRQHVRLNPCRDAERATYATTGFHTWTVPEVQQFMARHPLGTKAYLALCLLLFVGCRRADMVKLGRQHASTGALRYVPGKTSYKRKDMVEKPIPPTLAEAIAAGPCGNLTFLVTEYGSSFTPAGFGNWFRERCDEANLHHCSAHGLKKAGATIAAENGATVHMLMAMYDWTTMRQAEPYTRAANQKRLAAKTAQLVTLESVPSIVDVSREAKN